MPLPLAVVNVDLIVAIIQTAVVAAGVIGLTVLSMLYAFVCIRALRNVD